MELKDWILAGIGIEIGKVLPSLIFIIPILLMAGFVKVYSYLKSNKKSPHP